MMVELADVFRKYSDSYLKKHKLPLTHYKAIRAIENCRTANLGGHVDSCDECGFMTISYNSCRNRHCPKCQAMAKEQWIEARMNDLLPVQYFHVVFTLPEELNTLAFFNQVEVYNILFKATSQTLTELALDEKHPGAQIGFTAILHTWGQNLMHHPHMYCIVPGGGLSSALKWINSKDKFLIPVEALSKMFRGKFLFLLKQSFINNSLSFKWNKRLENQAVFFKLLSPLYDKDWFVYCKPPFKDAEIIEFP